MSTVQGGQGNIVTNGLVLNLDAANPRSYAPPFNGTTWTDLTGNNKNGILTNSPVYNSANGGSIVFNNTSSYCAFSGDTFNISPGTTGELSLEIWVYPTGPYSPYTPDAFTTNLGGFFGQGYFGGSTGWGIGMNTTSGINNFAFQVRNFSTISQPSTPFTNNNWYHVVGTFTRNENTRLYVNGVLTSTVSNTNIGNLTITPSINNAAIGRGGALPFYAGGNIATARIYNRPLSSAEVLQNFNATRARFGV
jgi:hypothetical protein